MNYLKRFFTVPSKEREAVFVLSGLFVLFFVLIPQIIRWTAPDFVLEYEIINVAQEEEVEETALLVEDFFNPNSISREELLEIGLGGRLATTWIRFRERVSPFREKEDLLRLYGMDTTTYRQLEPWIEIPEIAARTTDARERTPRKQFVRFHFDPNTLSADSLKLLGFPDRVATTIVNFRNSGGKFRQPEDILRIFNMPESLFYELEDWIKIQPESASESREKLIESAPDEALEKLETIEDERTSFTLQTLDLNTATAEELQQFRGIGQVLSNRIVAYRRALGGFHDVQQLMEVQGIQEEVLEQMNPLLLINKNMLSQININTATAFEMAQHPYINQTTAQRIVNYRNQNGPFAETEYILRIYGLHREWFEKAKWYLSVEQIPN